MIKLAICDDEQIMCDSLRDEIEKYEKEQSVELAVDIYNDATALMQGCESTTYDAMFLDIYLNEDNGFDVAKRLMKLYDDMHIIFITSNSALVYDSFEYRPFYFVRKDNYVEMLPKVLNKLQDVLGQNVELLLDSGVESVRLSRIYYIESDRHNVVLHTSNRAYSLRRKISEVECQLREYDFIRIHKGYLVNCRYVKRINVSEDEVVMDNDVALAMSRRMKNEVRERYRIYQRRMKVI